MSGPTRWLMPGVEDALLPACGVFFMLSVLIAMVMLGWVDAELVTEPLSAVSLNAVSLFIATSFFLAIHFLMRTTTALSRWGREALLPDARLLRKADPDLMRPAERANFERMNARLQEVDVMTGTILAGLSILTVAQQVSDPAWTTPDLLDLLGVIGCIHVLLWLATGTLVLRQAERGRCGRRLALTLLLRRTARLRKRRFLSRLPRRLVVRQYRGLRAE